MKGGCLSGCLSIFVLIFLCGACAVPPLLLASISFPASRLRIASDRIMVQWQAGYRPLQWVSSQGGPSGYTPDYTLYLDGEPVVQSSKEEPLFKITFLEGLTPGPHVLRLEARSGNRRAVHEVTFDIVDAPSPWRLETFPYEGRRRPYVFDALGRPVSLTVPGEEATPHLVFADRRGAFEFWKEEKRVTFRPWIWEQLGDREELPTPEEGQGLLVGPGFWLADRLYAWDDGAWKALPPLPQQVPEPVTRFFGEDIGPRLFREHANFFWARACGEEVWVSLTWRVSTPQGEHVAYVARMREGQWQVVPPPTPLGFFALYCFTNEVWLVNTASDGSPLEDGQLLQWGWFLNRESPWKFAENQGRGRTYRWAEGKWEETLAPPMVVDLDSVYNLQWMPSFYGPAISLLHDQTFWVVVPVDISLGR